MTTQNIHPENSDADVSVEGQPLASEATTAPTSPEMAAPAQAQPAEDSAEKGHTLFHQQEEQHSAPTAENQAAHDAQTAQAEHEAEPASAAGTHEPSTVEEQAIIPGEVLPQAEEGVVRPFTDFIEEFRQAEARQVPSLPEVPYSALDLLIPSVEPAEGPVMSSGMSSSLETGQVSQPAASVEEPAGETKAGMFAGAAEGAASERAEAATENLQAPSEPSTPVERPVSPLLRPASRVRLPRYGGRHREAVEKAVQSQAETPAPQGEPAPAPVEETPRPARRYRFDRPGAVNGSASVTLAAAPAIPPVRPEEGKEAVGRGATPATARMESEPAVEEVQPKQAAGSAQPPEQGATKQEAPAPQIVEPERRRRHSQDKHREKDKEKEQQAVPVSQATTGEVAAPAAKPAAPEVEGTMQEELPPLEYSEIQAASSRRRRRRRPGNSTAVTPAVAKPGVAEPAPAAGPIPLAPTSIAPVAPQSITGAGGQYNIVSGYTVSQMNQGNEASGPFMGPDPSPARGSTGVRETRAIRAETQRSPASIYPLRSSEPTASTLNHFANAVVQAIQTQTDRMVAELRRTSQIPTNISVSLPPFPSNERVGVFVDVANLLYSARTLRMAVDFGKLLDFLRGNRRLVRAHAYCPTSPQPGDEQMFLQAVKGLGYRITTKNYKTFSSGAKKADLDLDLCMDVVRLVDGKAVDCVVLVSGDSDFMPMLDYCSDHGVRVEVAAFDEAMSATLRQSCDLFINLSMLEEIRA